MKKKNGFISMALVYSFLVIFLFIMSSIINVYLRKNAYLEALENQVGQDIGITKESRATLISKILDNNIPYRSNNIDYTKISSINNGNGLYYTTDETGERIYFFRGNVDNNVVYGTETDGAEANSTQVCWKIIRTNNNGSIRLIYNGKLSNSGECTGDEPYIKEDVYNISCDDNAYVGFSYGATGSNSYDETHRKEDSTSSNIRTLLENWLKDNFTSSLKTKSVDAIYCNDRRVNSSNTGYGTMPTIYKTLDNINNKVNISYECENSMDNFSLKTSLPGHAYTNGFASNPIGLPTVADLIYAGAAYEQQNNDYYLKTDKSYWTMTPASFTDGKAHMFIVGDNGSITTAITNEEGIKVRPVISIGSDVKVSNGYGTKEEPYILE